MLGNWINDIELLAKQFSEAKPFEHVVLNNFLRDDIAELLYTKFPTPIKNTDLNWYYYNNPIEKKYALNDFSSDELETYKNIFNFLQSDEFVNYIKHVTGIENLEIDPYLHGAGLHLYPSNGKLDMHLDYSIHPKTGKERRVNIIYYLNKGWDDIWGGDLELRDPALSEESKVKISPKFNSAVLFRTCDVSFHGIPTPIKCPENQFRKSIAIYYVSEARENSDRRFKAKFYPLPGQPLSEELQNLYDIRSTRLITKDDLMNGWERMGNGYW
jgi:Rps23 Pro-64 3,4-dihydroxylase Tpa1-like proline 4-hydroxylase